MGGDFKQAMLQMFAQMQRNAIYLTYQTAAEPLAVGISRFGGQPDVPADFVWPRYTGEDYQGVVAERPLSFMAQINLAEAAAFDKDGLLPKSGLLSFFYEMTTEKWGFDPTDKGCSRVYYFADTAALTPSPFPDDLDGEFRLPEFALEMRAAAALPECYDFMKSPLTQAIPEQFPEAADFDWDAYEELRAGYGCAPPEDGWSETSKLLGWPNTIQGPMEYECEAVSRGVYSGVPQEIADELRAEIEQASLDWILLFQMGTVEHGDFELMFGDVGHIYYWIKKQDLAAGNFDKVWLILQCS